MAIRRHIGRWSKSLARRLGFEVRRSASCVGEMHPFLLHLRRRGFVPSRILDVGANQADWSRLAQQVFPEASFVLLEPQEEMLLHLKAFCEAAPGSRFILAAAGREAREMTLNVCPGNLPVSSLMSVDNGDRQYDRRKIPVVAIDSLYGSEDELPELAKLDIQGFELEALAGAKRLLGRTQCFILEVGLFAHPPARPLFAEVVAYMDKHGYKVVDIPGYLRRPLDGALGEVDLAFALKGGLLDRQQQWR
jgi:FkbM family methyltransferase